MDHRLDLAKIDTILGGERNSAYGTLVINYRRRATQCRPAKLTSQSLGYSRSSDSATNLVSHPPHRPRLLPRFYLGCTGPCSETSSAYRARGPSGKRLRRGRR